MTMTNHQPGSATPATPGDDGSSTWVGDATLTGQAPNHPLVDGLAPSRSAACSKYAAVDRG
jgi:hypothetical protein